jgi:release factor glutamine methyltransferase
LIPALLARHIHNGVSRSPFVVGRILSEATARLRSVTDAPRLEAEVLLSHTLGISRASLLAHPERVLTPGQYAACVALIERRASGYPLPYLTGRTEFCGLEFEVTPEVLIPRPETETLVELALACRPMTVVDVGTGSGCIAVSLAVFLPQVTVYAIDISHAALAVARRNAERHHVSDRVRLLAGDVLSPRPGPVDLVVSNPPYIPSSECALLPPSVRNYEPRIALDGGPDGLTFIRRLLKESPAVLRPGGNLLIEIGSTQGEDACHLARAILPQAKVTLHKDMAGRDRVLQVSDIVPD